MINNIHSVELIKENCIGCTDCIKRCPTEAIRVSNGKAIIRDNLCIDCGMCIRVCRSHAKKAVTDSLDKLHEYNYRIAIPAPSLYPQFKNIHDINLILTAIKRLGFDEVFEVARAAELVTNKTIEYIAANNIKKPIISSACPVIIRLISMRFPLLIDNILPLISPMELAAKMAKDLVEKKGIKRSKIGVFFISPCAAKKSYTMVPLGFEKSEVDCVISISDIYRKLRRSIYDIKPEEIENLALSSPKGVDWAIIGGESKGINIDNAIAVDGMENVIDILEEAENEQLLDVDFIEALACTGGCIGGPLTLENSFVSVNKMKKIQSYMSELSNDKKREISFTDEGINYKFEKPIERSDGFEIDKDRTIAINKLEEVETIFSSLPLIDCGSCGAPTCKALAEDIVNGFANEEDCVFMLREKISKLAASMVDLSSKMPQTASFNKEKK